MKKYLMYTNENTGEHIFERHDFGEVQCLTSEPENKEWNDCMYEVHTMFRMAELTEDKEALQKKLGDLDEWFVE